MSDPKLPRRRLRDAPTPPPGIRLMVDPTKPGLCLVIEPGGMQAYTQWLEENGFFDDLEPTAEPTATPMNHPKPQRRLRDAPGPPPPLVLTFEGGSMKCVPAPGHTKSYVEWLAENGEFDDLPEAERPTSPRE